MTRPLDGRAAIITGGSRGLGLEIARAFVGAGARVAISAREPMTLEAAAEQLRSLAPDPGLVAALPADVADPKAAERVVGHALERFGRIDVLVSNAGINGPIGVTDAVPWDEWEHTVRVNLFGPVLCARALLPHLRANCYGKIIQLSGGGATSPRPGFGAYATSKAAVVRFTETLAEELRGTGIDVNAVAPGALATRLLDEVLEAGPERVGLASYEQALRQRSSGRAPLDLAARLVVFLASGASDGITGKLISAPWDRWAELSSHIDDLAATDVYTLRRIVPADRGFAWD